MAPVYAVADDPEVDGRDFLDRFAAGMSHAPLDIDTVTCDALAARIRATPAPWEVALRTDTPRLVPTLVITGDDRPMYTEVAAALEAQGATHLPLRGAGHRPQDTPEGAAAITDWVARHGR